MVVSSGASPMAYILTNFNPDNRELRLYKFDPLKFTNNPVWVMGTSTCFYCEHLGLVFGRREKFLYLFSYYES